LVLVFYLLLKKQSSPETNEMCSAYRDEKSQLLLGVRRANRKQTALTSSVLSTDSMHIGVLAAAAHAAANRSPFTVYYNPRYIVAGTWTARYRAVPPKIDHQRSIEGEKGKKKRKRKKRREEENLAPVLAHASSSPCLLFVGTSSPADRPRLSPPAPMRGDGTSPHAGRKIETMWNGMSMVMEKDLIGSAYGKLKPQKVFLHFLMIYLVPQGFKLDFISGTLVKSQVADSDEARPAEHEQNFQDHNARGENGIKLQGREDASLHESIPQQSEVASVAFPGDLDSQSDGMIKTISHDMLAEHMDQLPKHQNGESSTSTGPFDHVNLAAQISAKQALQEKEQSDHKPVQQQNDTTGTQSPGLDAAQSSDMCNLNYLLPHQDCSHHVLDNDDWMTQHSCLQSFMGSSKTPEFPYINSELDSFYLPAAENATTSSADISSMANPNNFETTDTFQISCISDSGTPQRITTDIQEYLGTQLNSLDNELLVQGILSSEVHNLDVQGDCNVLQGVSNSYGIMDLSEESNNQGETISNLHLDPSNESMVIGHVPGVAIDGLSPIGSSRFQIPSVMPVCNFTSNQESMYHIASKRMTDSVFSLQDIPDSSAGTSSASIATNDCSLYRGSRKPACQQPLRTYTKVEY
ncbi:hypothetical protein GW17_00042157, partial [Ensete ventricosum]